ncbi:MAG: Uma2 family endonuclease [Acetobacteraceae bacterium]
MSEKAVRRMEADEFLEWHLRQEGHYELVDGVPVAMAGAKRRHDRVVVNAISALASDLGHGSCHPFSNDTAVRIPNGNIRYPDAGVDCGRFEDDSTWADAPFLVIEVLSESTRAFDLSRKLEEYKNVAGLTHIIFVDLDSPEVIHWRRDIERGWDFEVLEGIEAVIALPDLAMTLPLATLYAGLEFKAQPRLVYPE